MPNHHILPYLITNLNFKYCKVITLLHTRSQTPTRRTSSYVIALLMHTFSLGKETRIEKLSGIRFLWALKTSNPNSLLCPPKDII